MSTVLSIKDEKRMIRIRLQELLDERGVTLHWLAKQTGIRYATLAAIKNNPVERLNLNYLYIIMDVLEITDMNEILVRDDYYA